MRLILLFLAVLTTVIITAKTYENGEISGSEIILLSTDIFYIIVTSAKLI